MQLMLAFDGCFWIVSLCPDLIGEVIVLVVFSWDMNRFEGVFVGAEDAVAWIPDEGSVEDIFVFFDVQNATGAN